MQSVSSRIWTCVAVSISYDDNDYTTVSGDPTQIFSLPPGILKLLLSMYVCKD